MPNQEYEDLKTRLHGVAGNLSLCFFSMSESFRNAARAFDALGVVLNLLKEESEEVSE